MKRTREWGPTGVGSKRPFDLALEDDDWEFARNIVKTHLGRAPPPEFRKALDQALTMWQAGFEAEKETPKLVHYNLKRAHDAVIRLFKRLNDLGGNSRHLLAEIPDGDIVRLYKLARKIEGPLREARSKADQYPTTRAGQRNFPALNMGAELARGIELHLDQRATARASGLFAELYVLLPQAIRKVPRYKKVRLSTEEIALRAVIEFFKSNS